MKDIATSAELACPKCRGFGCDCDQPKLSFPSTSDVCGMCHRATALCICESHVQIRHMSDDSEAYAPVKNHNRISVELAANEAVRYYYARDPAGLARFIRQLLGNN